MPEAHFFITALETLDVFRETIFVEKYFTSFIRGQCTQNTWKFFAIALIMGGIIHVHVHVWLVWPRHDSVHSNLTCHTVQLYVSVCSCTGFSVWAPDVSNCWVGFLMCMHTCWKMQLAKKSTAPQHYHAFPNTPATQCSSRPSSGSLSLCYCWSWNNQPSTWMHRPNPQL